MEDWLPAATNTHQDHVIAHVVGATVLGYFVADEAAHFVLDIGFIWTVLLDGEMGLVPYSMALAELDAPADVRAGLSADVAALYDEGPRAEVRHVTAAPDNCLLVAVEVYAHAHGRRLLLQCEGASLQVETALTTGEIAITPHPQGID
jgi:hypothetical protein